VRWLRRGGADDGDGRAETDDGESDGAGIGEDSDTDARSSGGLTPRPDGPWDISENDGRQGYVDLGSLRLRGREGMELRLDVEEATGAVTAATVQMGDSAVQLQAFAAPRSEGIWPEIMAEIASGITQQGGTADSQDGVFGTELLARVPVRAADGRTGHQPARFAGIDGPRWFLRAVFHGAAVAEPLAAQELESVVRDVVVVRGADAMAPRELLPLHLPQEVTGPGGTGSDTQEGAEPAAGGDGRSHADLDPFARGPEITEVR
jgi:hypothetical protein